MQQGHPTDLSALNNLAWLYQRQGEFTKARELAERALAISPSDARVTNTLGWILLNQGEAARAVAYLTAAELSAPGSPDIQYHLAVALQRAGRAADDFDFAAAKDPVEPSQNLWSNEVFDGRRLVGKRAEHEAVERCHTQRSRTVILYPEVGWHTTLALHPALERHRLQIAAKVIAPGMVHAPKICGSLARVIEAYQRTAVRTAVFECRDPSPCCTDQLG